MGLTVADRDAVLGQADRMVRELFEVQEVKFTETGGYWYTPEGWMIGQCVWNPFGGVWEFKFVEAEKKPVAQVEAAVKKEEKKGLTEDQYKLFKEFLKVKVEPDDLLTAWYGLPVYRAA